MRSRKGFTLIELLVVIAIIAILAAILFPVFMRAKAAAQASHCQSGMNQIGKSVKMYLSDWEDTFPTNRSYNLSTNPVSLLAVGAYVKLSNPLLTDANQEPIRFQYGINWVEALYPYVEKVAEGDASSVWKCPAAKTSNGPGQICYPATTYAFNINMIEMPEGTVKNAGNLMLIREMDRKYEAILRPTNATPTNTSTPYDPFLDPWQDKTFVKSIKANMHGDGSIILFADGHVRNFSTQYFTKAGGEWDTQDQQWYNLASSIPKSDQKCKAIAITP